MNAGLPLDAGHDAGLPEDAGVLADAGVDAGLPEDAGGHDAGSDAGTGPVDAGQCGVLGEVCCAGDAGSSCSAGLSCLDSVCAYLWSQWPAPSDQPATNQYTDNADGTVTDTVTSLIWQKTLSGSTYSWSDAQTYCQGQALHGLSSGWRLPTMNELITLVDYGNNGPAINTTVFPLTPTGNFWTATPSTNANFAYEIDFTDGTAFSFAGVSGMDNVRCVHSAP